MTTRLKAIAPQRAIRTMALLPVVVATALVTGCGDKSNDAKATQAAARVNGNEITVHQINQVLARQQGLKPEQAEAVSKQALEGLIDQQLAVAKAEEQKLDRDPQVVQLLEATRRNILASTYLTKAAASGVSQPTAEDIRKYYNENPALFSERKVYAIQEFTVPLPGDKGKELIEKLKPTRGSTEFSEVLKASGAKFSVNQITQAAEGLPLGIISPLSKVSDGEALYISANDGFKALLVIASKSQPIALDQAKPAIEQYLIAERKREFVQKEIKNLRDAAKIEYVGKFSKTSGEKTSPPTSSENSSAPQKPNEDKLNPADISKGISGLK